MSDSPSVPPPDRTISEIRTEQSLLDGTVLAGAAYGVHLTLFIQCFSILVQRQRNGKLNWPMLIYICVLFTLGTVGFGGQIKFNEMTFIQNRNFPGGPLAFNFSQYNEEANLMTTAAFIILNWLADGLLIYRLFMIWNGNWFVTILPALMLAASFSVSVVLLVQLTQPGSSLWTTVAINLGIPYWSISVSINIVVTMMIVGRLLYLRSKTRIALTREHAQMYTSVVAMLIESAALYSITGLMFIISYALNSMVQNVMLPVLGHVQAVSPLLIILRVAQGRAWSKDTVRTVTGATYQTTFNAPNAQDYSRTDFSGTKSTSRVQKGSVGASTQSTLAQGEDQYSIELGEK